MKVYSHILLPVDFSESGSALNDTAILAAHYLARLTLLHVIEHFPEDLPTDNIGPENVDPETFLIDSAQVKFAALERTVNYRNVDHDVIVSNSSAQHEILRYAQEHDIDLIVLSPRHSSTLSRIAGATTFGVVQNAHCDVLVNRTH